MKKEYLEKNDIYNDETLKILEETKENKNLSDVFDNIEELIKNLNND